VGKNNDIARTLRKAAIVTLTQRFRVMDDYNLMFMIGEQLGVMGTNISGFPGVNTTADH
jgi:hypothetical protein